MKAKISTGAGFRGALNYIFDQGKESTGNKKPEIVAGNMSGNTAEELSAEFSAVKALRPDIEKSVWHCSLSLPAGQALSSEKWNEVASDFMQKMKFDENTPWVATRHNDTQNDHIHIVASRIGIDSKVWLGRFTVYEAIKATQELEKKHNLVQTRGFEGKAEKKALTSNELNMAVRTQTEPPRQKLQRIIDEVIKDKPTAVQFAQQLETTGIKVRANIASTGKMNGFSFEVDEIAFKGSDLGKSYTWGGLQKAGVTYEQARDGAELERFKASNSAPGELESSRTKSVEHTDKSPDIAGSSRERDHQTSPTNNEIQRESEFEPTVIRQNHRDPTPHNRGSGPTNNLVGNENDRSPNEKARLGVDRHEPKLQQNVAAHNDIRESTSEYRGYSRQINFRGDEADKNISGTNRSSKNGADRPNEESSDAGMRAIKRNDSVSWSVHFETIADSSSGTTSRGFLASVRSSNGERKTVADTDRQEARKIDPTNWLQSQGFEVKKEGRHISIRKNDDEIYRATKKDDGKWLWCDRHGNHGGDNIDLIKEIQPETRFSDAVYQLLGSPKIIEQEQEQEQKPKILTPREPLKLPEYEESDVKKGREYLQKRGISSETITRCEKVGILRYTGDGVLFVGRDENGKVKNVTKRSTNPSEPVQKRDIKGSDKSYAAVIPGESKKVWIVEGGTDALAVLDLAKRQNQPAPTIIISGGANVRSFLERPAIQSLLKTAEKIGIAGENEKDKESQIRADVGRSKQIERIKEIASCEVKEWTPPAKYKDVAELNEKQVAEIEKKKQEELEKTQQRKERSMDRGMSK